MLSPWTVNEKMGWLLLLLTVLTTTTTTTTTPTLVNAMVVERPSSSSQNRNQASSNSGRTSKNQSWYNKRRNQGIKVPRRGTKPPQWEKEGDILYQEIVQDNPYRTVHEKMTFPQAQKLLSDKLERTEADETMTTKILSSDPPPSVVEANEKATYAISPDEEPPYLWGGLSVGPFWKQRLVQAGFTQPTPIQAASFTPIIKDTNNLVVASATGSGKSLAYLLPLLTTRKEDQVGRVWILTPTTELALQLQRMVSNLLGEDTANNPSPNTSTLQVVSSNKASADVDDDDDDDEMPILASLADSSSYMLAGTARTFQQLMDEMDQPIIVNKKLRQTAKNLLDNMEVLVFDEADRLFQTEAVARNYQERLQQKADINNNNSSPSPKKRRQQPRLSTPLSLKVLESISNRLRFHQRAHQYTTTANKQSNSTPSSSQFKIICASATVGRTLRRQLMEALQAPSMDKAATLITADVRTKKDATARKSSLLPSTLHHAYQLLPEECDESSSSPEVALVSSMVDTLQKQLEPAPTLIFPGRIGVAAIQSGLKASGFQKVYGLEDVGHVGNNPEDNSTTSASSWSTTPIFVVSEKLGRGLDIPQLGYVVMLQVPSSAAGYTHLAGRTGRNGHVGTAVTFCRSREVPKLVVIAETLGLTGSFQNLESLLDSSESSEKN